MANNSYFGRLSDVQEQMMTPGDRKTREFAYHGAKLAKAQADSKFWGSWKGTARMLPSAMKDTVMGVIKKRVKK